MDENARAQFAKAIELGVEVRRRQQHGEDGPDEMQAAFDQADGRLFARVRALFGGEIRQAVTGAAPIASEILEFFYACGVPVMEGWGMTETTAVGTVGTLEHFKFGTVGRPMPGVEAKIAEEDGEILLRGPNIFREYGTTPTPRTRRWSTAGYNRRRRRDRRRGLPQDHRPQEGHHHHRRGART